jgi:outer membrane immunogenic protein
MKTKIAFAFGITFLTAAISQVSQQALAQTAPVNWSGSYVGGNVGYGWGKAHSSQSGAASSFSGAPIAYVPNSFDVASTSGKTALDNILGGVQLGYNFSSQRWIIGAEADLQFGRQSGNTFLVSPLSGSVCNNVILPAGPCSVSPVLPSAVNGPVSTTVASSIDWFGTVRGRLGYLVSDNLLVFATGGLAYGQVKVSTTTNVAVTVANGILFAPDSSSAHASSTKFGFALGAGLQGVLPSFSPNWTWKVEYLYADLGSLDTSAPFALVRTGSPSLYYTPITGSAVMHTRFTDNTLRIGLNYRLAP